MAGGKGKKRVRRVHSIKAELLKKSRESALAAVQVFNNPNITFKSEIYAVLMVISWTYLLHAYYRENGVEYRYFRMKGSRRSFDKTRNGADKHWELERCINESHCPLNKHVKNNLRFMIRLRHEIEHQMTTRIDDLLSARFQACCLNYNAAAKELFGSDHGIDRHLSFSLQFASLTDEQVKNLESHPSLPGNIHRFIQGFDSSLSDAEYSEAQFSYRVLFVAKTANRKGQADRVIEFVKAGSEVANKVNATYAFVKETERKKWLPSEVVSAMKREGFTAFRMHEHTQLWKELDAKKPGRGMGIQVATTWYWYDCWVETVREHCKLHSDTNTLGGHEGQS